MRLISTLKKTAAILTVATTLAATAPVAVAQDIPLRVVGAVMVDEMTMAPMQFAIEVDLAASPADVFAFVTNTDNIANPVEGVDGAEMAADGMFRNLIIADGSKVKVSIHVNGAGKMSFAYSLDEGNPMGLSNHLGVLHVRHAAVREGAVLTWQQYYDGPASNDDLALYTNAAAIRALGLVGTPGFSVLHRRNPEITPDSFRKPHK